MTIACLFHPQGGEFFLLGFVRFGLLVIFPLWWRFGFLDPEGLGGTVVAIRPSFSKRAFLSHSPSNTHLNGKAVRSAVRSKSTYLVDDASMEELLTLTLMHQRIQTMKRRAIKQVPCFRQGEFDDHKSELMLKTILLITSSSFDGPFLLASYHKSQSQKIR